MVSPTVFIVTRDRRFTEAVRGAAARLKICLVACVSEVSRIDRRTWVVLNGRRLPRCCRRSLRKWKRRLRHLQVIPLKQLRAMLNDGMVWIDPRRAWKHRARLLATHGRVRQARLFLSLARQSERRGTRVQGVAETLGVEVRTLDRRCLDWFGQTPSVILGLARIASIERDLLQGCKRLDQIAEEHGFSEASAMSRQFLRYVGQRPGAYRARARHRLAGRPAMWSDSVIDSAGSSS